MATATKNFVRFEDRVPIDVFVVSPNVKLRDELKEKLCLPRWCVREAGGGAEAFARLREHSAEDAMLLLDPQLPDLDPDEFDRIVRDRFPNTQVLVLNSHTGQLLIGTGSPTPVSRKLADAVNRSGTLRAGPFSLEAEQTDPYQAEGKVQLRSMVGKSEPMLRTYALTRMVAARDTTVLVTGESGTGKELIAQEIHLISQRRNRPLL